MTAIEALDQMRQKHQERINATRREIIELLMDDPDVRVPISIAQLLMLEDAGFVLNFENGDLEVIADDHNTSAY